MIDLEGRIIIANRAKANMLGYDNPEYLTGRNGIELIVEKDRAKAKEALFRALEKGSVTHLRLSAKRKDGSEFPADFSAIMLRDADGRPEMFVSIMKDIEQPRKAEEELNIQKAFFENLFENSPLAIVILDNNDRVVDFNKEFGRLFGYSENEAIGNQINDLIVPYDLQDEGWQATEDVAGGKQIEFETVRTDKSGRKFDVNVIGKPILIGKNQLAVYGIYQDISERKRAREELQKIARLESIGIMAGGIAHNFKNLLASMALNTGFIKAMPEKAGLFAEKIEKSIEAATKLATRFQTFSTGSEPSIKPVHLANLVEDAASIALSGTNIDYTLDSDCETSVEVDPQQMNEALTNLMINASESMPQGGLVRLKCENININEDYEQNLKPGKYLKVSIIDEGKGIPQEYLQKIFEPFFSTKVGGHGLGLSAAHLIVRKHEGAITVDSEVGRGSVFNVFLPVIKTRKKRRRKHKTAESPKKSGRVLFMDDEPEIRESMADMARILGYEIITARNGEEAIEKYEQSKEKSKEFDAVVLDLTVRGGMGGEETLNRLKKIDSKVKAIVFSGHSTKPIIANYRKYGFVAKMEKPITMDEFAETLNQVIASDKK
jgi:PAS domain S-box-containing protein